MASEGKLVKFESIKADFLPQRIRPGSCFAFDEYFNHLGVLIAVDDGADFKLDLVAFPEVEHFQPWQHQGKMLRLVDVDLANDAGSMFETVAYLLE